MKKTISSTLLFILIISTIITLTTGSAFASDSIIDDSSTADRKVIISLPNAVKVAEKMYYCGELYLFADSMIKTNYEMAAITANVQEALQSNTIIKDTTMINDFITEYNKVCDTFNSWVDVRLELENYVSIINDRKVFTSLNIQTIFRNTLTTINNIKELLENTRAYIEDPSSDSRKTLDSSASKTIRNAARANTAIEPLAQKAMTNYRSFFDAFIEYAGITLEYRDPTFVQSAAS